jgi:hypothetical protein
MKKLLLITYSIILLFSCDEEEKKLELFSPETYAYQLDSGWELNAMIQVKGLAFKIQNENYIYSVTYSADLITPSKDTLKSIDNGSIEETASEKLYDIGVEFQTELDSTFLRGKYEIIFYIKDDFSGFTTSFQSAFVLTDD